MQRELNEYADLASALETEYRDRSQDYAEDEGEQYENVQLLGGQASNQNNGGHVSYWLPFKYEHESYEGRAELVLRDLDGSIDAAEDDYAREMEAFELKFQQEQGEREKSYFPSLKPKINEIKIPVLDIMSTAEDLDGLIDTSGSPSEDGLVFFRLPSIKKIVCMSNMSSDSSIVQSLKAMEPKGANRYCIKDLDIVKPSDEDQGLLATKTCLFGINTTTHSGHLNFKFNTIQKTRTDCLKNTESLADRPANMKPRLGERVSKNANPYRGSDKENMVVTKIQASVNQNKAFRGSDNNGVSKVLGGQSNTQPYEKPTTVFGMSTAKLRESNAQRKKSEGQRKPEKAEWKPALLVNRRA